MVRGVAFDLEGTVVDVERAHHDAFLAILSEHGCPMGIERAIEDIPRFIGGGDPAVLQGIKEYTRCQQSVEELLVRKMELYRATLKTMAAQGVVRPREGFHLVLGALRDMRIPTTIGSLTPLNQAMELMEYAGIAKMSPIASRHRTAIFGPRRSWVFTRPSSSCSKTRQPAFKRLSLPARRSSSCRCTPNRGRSGSSSSSISDESFWTGAR